MRMNATLLRRGMGWWPPFLGAGIRVRSLAEDFRDAVVELRFGRLNRNYVGTHFGGSLYTMTDPFFAIMLMHNLGGEKVLPEFQVEVRHVGDDSLVALVRKTLYVRLKPKHRPQGAA